MNKKYNDNTKHNDSIDNKDKTEYAPELTADDRYYTKEERKDGYNVSIMGYLAIFASIVSLFTYPVTFGVIGIILGVISIYSGSKTLGYWAIGIGVVTSVSSLFFRVALFSYIFSMFY
ncbi:hypothetical protein [Tepidibacter hydrothermalis]|uniref:Uncharacterized protein n=1 Tax=Tepidibacter hydrothermalis TaxID=3036126 RepID=A0ABY8E7J3_9FIRM|nr:hypothetical protein [Tepidibacter hydrothermalis]WFD08842.1 hypothetical protein P4S50_10590 [Tepidibacter hydrothermalis]